MEQPPLEEVPEDENGNLYWKISDNAIDYENPDHILALMDNYVSLLKHSYDKPDSETRTLCYDLEYLVENADLTDLEQYCLEQRIAHRNTFVIQKYLAEDNIHKTEAQLRTIMRENIPNKIARTAMRLRLESQFLKGEIEGLKCTKCGGTFPKHPFYFARSRDKRTGYCSQCKECQRQKSGDRIPARVTAKIRHKAEHQKTGTRHSQNDENAVGKVSEHVRRCVSEKSQNR
jgi:hypothetical protein